MGEGFSMSFVARVSSPDLRLKVTFQIFVGDDVTAATKKASYGLQFFSIGVGVRGGGWGTGGRGVDDKSSNQMRSRSIKGRRSC